MRVLKELYLSIFVMFYRMSRWRGSMKARTAASGLTIVEGFFATGIGLWVAAPKHQFIRTSGWIVAFALVLLYLLNDYLLVDQGRGIAFEQEFRGFPLVKRTLLYVVAVGIALSSVAVIFVSIISYRDAFHVSQR
jgi:cytochrome c biogenesis factor